MTTKELEEAVLSTFESHRVPMLIGDPGVGKTAFASSLGKRVGGKAVIVNLSHKDGAEVHGLPMMGETKTVAGQQVPSTTIAPPDYAVEAVNSSTPTVILYDELTSVSSSQVAPALAIFADRMLGGLYLPPEKVYLIGCCNPAVVAAGGFDLPPPMANRLCFFNFEVDALEWAKNFPSYWGNPPRLGVRSPGMTDQEFADYQDSVEVAWSEARIEVAAYIKTRTDVLNALPKTRAEQSGPWPSCRSWDFVSRSLAFSKLKGHSTEVMIRKICGDIGDTHGTEFVTWRESAGLIDVGQLLRNPKGFKLPTSVDVQYHLLNSIPLFVINAFKFGNTEATTKKRRESKLDFGSEMWSAAWVIIEQFLAQGGPKDLALIATDRLLQSDCYVNKKLMPPPSIKNLAETMSKLKLSSADIS